MRAMSPSKFSQFIIDTPEHVGVQQHAAGGGLVERQADGEEEIAGTAQAPGVHFLDGGGGQGSRRAHSRIASSIRMPFLLRLAL